MIKLQAKLPRKSCHLKTKTKNKKKKKSKNKKQKHKKTKKQKNKKQKTKNYSSCMDTHTLFMCSCVLWITTY